MYLADCRARGLSPRTLRNAYGYPLKQVLIPWCHQHGVREPVAGLRKLRVRDHHQPRAVHVLRFDPVREDDVAAQSVDAKIVGTEDLPRSASVLGCTGDANGRASGEKCGTDRVDPAGNVKLAIIQIMPPDDRR